MTTSQYARTPLTVALDRVQATHGEFMRHIETCDDAMHGRWTLCNECVGLDRDANAASYQFGLLNRRGHLVAVK